MPAPDEPEAFAEARRQELSRWLQQKRERIPSATAGLRPLLRRRSTGLTQFDVARLAGIDRRTYQMFEQGQVHPTAEVFTAVVGALRLTPDEVKHLCYLADIPQPAEPGPVSRAIPPEAVAPLLAVIAAPALVYDAAMTVVAGNDALARMAPSLVASQTEPINLLRWLFTVDTARVLFVDFDDVAREAIGRLRVSRARYDDPTVFDALVAELCAVSPLARQLWDDESVLDFEPGRNTYRLRGPDGSVRTMSFATVALLGMPPGLRMICALSQWDQS